MYQRFLEGSDDSSSLLPAESIPSDDVPQAQAEGVSGEGTDGPVDAAKVPSEFIVSGASQDTETLATVDAVHDETKADLVCALPVESCAESVQCKGADVRS